MVKNQILIVGDNHFTDRYEGILDAQVDATVEAIQATDIEDIVFLGDVSDARKPTPTVLLAIQRLLDKLKNRKKRILRGNHDALNKSDDGVTYLNVFESKHTTIYNHIRDTKIKGRQFTFIPHYEDERVITKKYSIISPESIAFGHFGYIGCINGVPDYVFSINPGDIRNFTILGHVHRTSRAGLINVVGTPYPTGFYDSEVNCGTLGVLEFDENHEELSYINVDKGPRFITKHSSQLEGLKLDENTYNVVRVLLDSDSDKYTPDLIKELITKYPIRWVDIRIIPKVDSAPKEMEGITLKHIMDKSLLDQYLEKIELPFSISDLMKVYTHIKNEN